MGGGTRQAFLPWAHLQPAVSRGPELGTQIRPGSHFAGDKQLRGRALPKVTQLIIELGFEPLTY